MHLQLQQPVAMKFLLPDVISNQQVVQRFLREAQAAVRLRSEHVARVIDVGALETGAPYMVLEYLEGGDLSSFPRSQLTVGGIVDLVLQACEALAEAHSLGIVHRDIKPANCFITRRADGTLLLKVLDFGISKISTMNGQLTATQAVMGTPAYMSPEQMRSSRDVDHRSDIWSLGVVLYELLQGAPPFGGDTFSSMVLKVVNDPLPRLTVRLPGDLENIVYRCLEKDPAKRFQNTAELAHALARYAQSETQAAISVQRTRGIVGLQAPHAAFETDPSGRAFPSTISGAAGARTMPRRRGRRWPTLAVGLLAGAIVVAIAAVNGGGKTEDRSPSAQPEGPPSTAPPPPPEVSRDSAIPAVPASSPAVAVPTSTAPPVEAAPPPAPAPVATPPPARPTPTTASSESPTSTTPSSTAAKTSKKHTKASVSPAKAGSSEKRQAPPAKSPSPADDDVLDTRN
ncbi:MAG TPA: serine/threonine-protein kinase [Kofleriaceae bacterium]